MRSWFQMANSKRRCKHCKTYVTDWLQLPAGTFCSTDHAIEWTRTKEAQERAKKVARAETAEKRKSIETLSAACAKARKDAQKLARIRDAKYGVCIACGVAKIEDGGHFFAVGSKYRTSRLSLDLRVIHGCCAKCNRFVGGGNHAGFEAGLIARYGEQFVAELKELKRISDSGEEAPLTKEEVRAIAKDYRAATREIMRQYSATP